MGKANTSRKREFSFENMPELELKRGIKFPNRDSKETFQNVSLVYTALMQSLTDGDADAFKEILAAFLSVTNKDRFAAKAKISKRTLSRMISSSGNPTLENVARVVHALAQAI